MDLSKDNVKSLKGIAILLMVYLHLFWNNDIIYVSEFAKFANICVPIYVFLSGYGLSRSKKNTLKESLHRISKFYRQYCPIFILSVVSLLLFTDLHFRLEEFILNLFCISYSYNHIWWFIPMYFLLVFLYPTLYRTIEYGDIILVLFLIVKILGKLLLGSYAEYSPVNFPDNLFAICNSLSIYLIVFYMGILCGSENRCHKVFCLFYMKSLDAMKMSKKKMFVSFIAIVLIIVFCPFAGLLYFILVPYICLICSCLHIGNWAKIMGNYSTIIWLFHGILLKCLPESYFLVNPILLYTSFVMICLLFVGIYNKVRKYIVEI